MPEFPHLIEAQDDGLEAASYRQHTLEKLSIEHYYLDGFNTACKRTKRYGGWTFVDSFAGSGLVQVRDTGRIFEGSTLIGLKSGADRVHAVERDARRIRALEQRVAQRGLEHALATHVGDANQLVGPLVATERARTPIFVLHDPEGVELAWRTVESVATARASERRWKPEQLINFTAGVVRLFWLGRDLTPQNVDALDRFFGAGDWRSLLESRRLGEIDAHDAVRSAVDLHKSRLRSELDHAHVLDKPITRDMAGSGSLAYHLIFASDHPDGEKIMKYAFDKALVGQMHFQGMGL